MGNGDPKSVWQVIIFFNFSCSLCVFVYVRVTASYYVCVCVSTARFGVDVSVLGLVEKEEG